MGSVLLSTPIIAPTNLDRHQILRNFCHESVRKGLKPGNLVRHELDVGSLGAHKAEALAARLKALAAGISVSYRRVILGGQEASGNTASVLDELATCDLLIDATADPQAFNFIASVARNALRPMIWAEVYAGGIGGFVGRVRPGSSLRHIQHERNILAGVGAKARHGTASIAIMQHAASAPRH